MPQTPTGPPSVAAVFDAIASTYDASGVELFRPVGRRLVELLGPQPGDRALDIGCGRGAVTVPLAEAVGQSGHVTALDVSGAMVELTRSVTAELPQVTVATADASRLEEDTLYDVIAASLVLFFVSEPLAALLSWVGRLGPEGRIGVSTFGPRDEATTALDALLAPYAPPGLLDARTTGTNGPFATDAGVAGLLRDAGARDVRTVLEPVSVEVPDAATWERFSRSTGQSAMWNRLPETDRAGVLAQAAEILGGPPLIWHVRYSLGAAQ